ncbi:MAG: tyrosine-type recombinase/integrase [Planctomycetes bacterium]|nr:tyrosine-type recombinase/integrase [Planctomycetota bacterium]
MTHLPWEVTSEQVLSENEVERLLHHVREAERGSSGAPTPAVDRLIIESLLFSGLRCSEFCLLRLEDAPHAPADRSFVVRGRTERRTVWLPTPVAEICRTYRRQVRPLLAARAGGSPSDALLLNERGRSYERTGLYRRVTGILDAAGLARKASVQLLRHTYGYLAYLRTGGNLLFVQRQLGHAHPMITAVYANLVRESYVDLADAVKGIKGAEAAPRRALRRASPSTRTKRAIKSAPKGEQ